MKNKKRRKEKKRREKVLPRFELGPFGVPGESFTTRQRGTHTQDSGIFIIKKPSSLIKHEFKDIFQKNDCSLDSENPT